MTQKNKIGVSLLSTKLAMFLLGILLFTTTGCGKGNQAEMDKLKKEKEAAEAKNKKLAEALRKGAVASFSNDIGKIKIGSGIELSTANLLTSLGSGYSSISNAKTGVEGLIDGALKKSTVCGAMKDFLETDNYKSWFSSATEVSHHVASLYLILWTVEALKAKATGKPEDFKKDEFIKVLTDAETKAKTLSKYELGTTNNVTGCIKKHASDTFDLMKEAPFQKAWKAFRARVENAVDSYGLAMGVEVTQEKAKEKAKS